MNIFNNILLLLKRKPILLFLSVFLICIVHGQNNKLDSLNNLITKAKTDTVRINLINKKVFLLSNTNLDSAIYYGLQNLQQAQRIKYYRGELDARMKLAANYCFKGNYNAAKETLIYLEKFIIPGNDSVDIANVYGNYGMMYGMQSKYDSSINFYEKAIAIFERQHDSTRLASNYSNIAIGYQQLSNFPKALEYQQKA
jgi:tetratricopeptide (TPR) repeat protein